MSHVWMSHVTHTNVARWIQRAGDMAMHSFDTYGCVMSRMWMSRVTHTHVFRWISKSWWYDTFLFSNIWMSHVTRVDESCNTYECGSMNSKSWWLDTSLFSDVWMSHITRANESCHIWRYSVMYGPTNTKAFPHRFHKYASYHIHTHTHISYTWDSARSHGQFLITQWQPKVCSFMCDVTISYVWRASFIMCVMSHSHVWHYLFMCVIWLVHTCATTHSYVWCVPWLIHMCDITHFSHVCRNTFICVPWLTHMCGRCPITQWQPKVIASYSYVPWLIHSWHDCGRCPITHGRCPIRHVGHKTYRA